MQVYVSMIHPLFTYSAREEKKDIYDFKIKKIKKTRKIKNKRR